MGAPHLNPPDGWFTFGTHVEHPGVEVQFSVELGSDGLPLWERPVTHSTPHLNGNLPCICPTGQDHSAVIQRPADRPTGDRLIG